MTLVSLGRRAARGTLVTLAGQVGKFSIQALGIVVISRIIAPGEFGMYVMIASVAGLAAVVGDFGLSYAAIQVKSLNNAERSNLFWLNVVLGLTGTLCFLALSPMLASFYGSENLTPIAAVMSVVFLFNGLTVQHRAELTRRMRFLSLTAADISSQLAGLACAIALALGGWGIWALVCQQLVSLGMVLVFSWFMAGWMPGLPNFRVGLGRFLRFGGHTFGGSLINYISSNADNVVLGRYASAADVGIYGRMYQLFSLPMQQLAAPLTRVALPILASLNEAPERYLAFLKRAQLCLAYVFVFTFTVLAVAAPGVVKLVLGDGWEGGTAVLQMLAIGGIFQGLGYVYYWIFLSRARMDIQFRLGLVSRAIMVGAIVLCGPLGMYWVAAAAAGGLALNWTIYTIWGVPRADVDIRALLVVAIRPALVFIPFATVGVLYGAQMETMLGPILFTASAVGSAVVYLLVIASIATPVRRDCLTIFRTAALAIRRSPSLSDQGLKG